MNKGNEIESLPGVYRYKQLISHATHVSPESLSWTDLTFADQPNLVIETAFHPSLHPIFHDQSIHCKLNFSIK